MKGLEIDYDFTRKLESQLALEFKEPYGGLLLPGRFPKRDEAIRKLGGRVTVVEVHDDGDLTIRHESKLYVVTTEGDIFAHYTPEEALKKILAETYWWVRLGYPAEYEKFGTVDEAKKYVERRTGKHFTEAKWVSPYGFELAQFVGRNYIIFFEGNEAVQPTERHLWGKSSSGEGPSELEKGEEALRERIGGA